MRKKYLITALVLFLLIRNVHSQDRAAVELYIEKYKDLAMQEMTRTGVPAAIKLAQGIHETEAGNSVLVKKSNNHFGIKCKSWWTGKSVKHTDDARNECFRKYNSPQESYLDHSDFLKLSPHYAFLFDLDPADYEGWARGLKKAGYATNPKYSQILIKLIEDYRLQEYSLLVLGKTSPKKDAIVAVAEKETGQAGAGPVFTDLRTGGQEKTTATQLQKIVEQKPVYPEGEFKIYDTRVVYAVKGTSFLSIAQQYDVPLSRIYEFNEITQAESAEKDGLIYIQRKRTTGKQEFHIIKPGETLHDIAQEEAIRFESLLQYNMLTREMIPAVGEKLYLKYKAPALPRLAEKSSYSLSNTPGNAIH